MGATATTALATAVVPYGPESKAEGDLNHMMAGAMEALSEADCLLVGGHTSEGAELALGAFKSTTYMQSASILCVDQWKDCWCSFCTSGLWESLSW